jgi:hypothetical protein
VVTPAVVSLLLDGFWLPDFLPNGQPQPTDEHLREIWADVGDRVLEWHLHGLAAGEVADLEASPGRPGSRPWAWWKFEAPEPRRQLVRYVDPVDGTELVGIGPADWYGTPSKFNGRPPAGMYESEVAYLRRLGLLQPEELKLYAEGKL